jgi:hypothetical protein
MTDVQQIVVALYDLWFLGAVALVLFAVTLGILCVTAARIETTLEKRNKEPK